ncbi:MAG: hypothetical protein K0R65_2771 [Crocinitomicaceae bacterium]|jgi:hypothetical protein|nr:hypothetical protein [Crocinitomicaceae bacterium]
MKNKYFFNLIGALALGFAAQAQVLNSGFENWTAGDPDNWSTSNSVGAGLVTISETTDQHGGSKAVRGEVVSFFGTLVPPFLQAGEEGLGFAVSQNHTALNLFYKFNPQGGDRFSVNVACYNNGTAIGSGAIASGTAVASYTPLSVPLTYFGQETADTIIIQFAIIGPNTGSDFHAGSEVFIDDVSFDGTAGLNENPGLSSMAFPNPCSERLFVPTKPGAKLHVFDLQGKEIQISYIENNGHCQLDVSSLDPGNYVYSLENQGSLTHGRFNVNR